MTFYTNAVKTWTIDPVFNQSKVRSEFRIEANNLYASTFRLLNVGVTVDILENRYNYLIGAQPISRIVLYDGKTVLDSIDYHNYEAFNRYKNTNSVNCDIAKPMKKHGLGFTFYREKTDQNIMISEFRPLSDNKPHMLEENSPKGFINLREVFPLLKAMQYVHTGIFTDLKVVVQYTTTDVLAHGASKVTGTTQPLLVVDQIMNDQLAQEVMSGFKSVSWLAIESETVSVPLVKTTDTNQTLKFKLTGFCNKTLNRLLVQKQILGFNKTTEPVVDLRNKLYGNAGSIALIEDSYKFLVNGADILSDTLIGANLMLGLLSDTWGNCNSYTSCNDLSLYYSNKLLEDAQDRGGYLSYVGLNIGQKVNDLQVEFSRFCPTGCSLQYSQALNLNFFGEVSKAIIKTTTGYRILYA